jgi:hypothetical protein
MEKSFSRPVNRVSLPTSLENLGRVDSADGRLRVDADGTRSAGRFSDVVPETPDTPLARRSRHSTAYNISDDEVDEIEDDYDYDELAQSPQMSRYALIHSPMRSPPGGNTFNISQSLSEADSVCHLPLRSHTCSSHTRLTPPTRAGHHRGGAGGRRRR